MEAASFAFYCEVTSKKAKIQRTARPEGARHIDYDFDLS
jgi:hypothetical protein